MKKMYLIDINNCMFVYYIYVFKVFIIWFLSEIKNWID